MFALPWVAIFLAVPATWSVALRWLGVALLVVGYGAALASGLVGVPALLAIGALLVAAYAVSSARARYVRYLGHALFIALAVALIMHWLPGFHNPRVIDRERFTPDAVPFTMYLNLDKPLVGFWLLLVLPWVRSRQGVRQAWLAGVGGWLITSAVCFVAALLLGFIAWAPKWPADSGLFLLNNLLLVTFVEEAFFRGYLQGGIGRLLEAQPYGKTIALVAAAALFGLMHLPAGLPLAVFGGIAGLGYGLAYRWGGLSAAVLAHFGLNAAQFLLFTYPMLQPVAH